MALLKRCNYLTLCHYKHSLRPLHDTVNFRRPKLFEGYLYENVGKRYYVLKGNYLYAFTRKYLWDTATATEIFDLATYDKVKQVSYNNNKFSLESSTENDKRIFSTETTKEMLSWIRNIQCVQQNILNPQIHFIDP